MEEFAEKLSNRITSGIDATETETATVKFAIEVFLINSWKLGTFLILSALTHTFWPTLVTYLSFLALRSLITGFHALSDFQCFIVTQISFWLIPLAIVHFAIQLPIIFTILLEVGACICILKYGAKGTKLNPVASTKQKGLKMKALVVLGVLTVISTLPAVANYAVFIQLGILTAIFRVLPITEKIFIKVGKIK